MGATRRPRGSGGESEVLRDVLRAARHPGRRRGTCGGLGRRARVTMSARQTNGARNAGVRWLVPTRRSARTPSHRRESCDPRPRRPPPCCVGPWSVEPASFASPAAVRTERPVERDQQAGEQQQGHHERAEDAVKRLQGALQEATEPRSPVQSLNAMSWSNPGGPRRPSRCPAASGPRRSGFLARPHSTPPGEEEDDRKQPAPGPEEAGVPPPVGQALRPQQQRDQGHCPEAEQEDPTKERNDGRRRP